ncbi:MAG: HAD hydrolase family protein [Candidatus Lokiarchaeota archaeon]|nr:HAD hydrolase family protein [Candidatus Lokiarchaeota archaeon]
MKNKKVCCWDLEGPISTVDFAADIGKLLSNRPELSLQDYDMGEFFFMISNYDDYIIDTPGIKERLNISEYQPGDTLRIMAPLYLACYSETELLSLAQQNLGLLPGCMDLMGILHREWDVYVISTSYTQFAHTITGALSIPQDHVYCTDFNIDLLKKGVNSIENSVHILVKQIFKKYLDNDKDLETVLEDLNDFFWKSEDSDYFRIMNKIKVRGGKRKELAIEDISKRTGTPISDMIALGDSITDINMLQRLKQERGIAVSFNGNEYTISRATIAITTPNNLGVLPVFESINNIEDFLKDWVLEYPSFVNNPQKIKKGLISNECRDLFIKYDFVPEIDDLRSKNKKEILSIIEKQKKMRKLVRGWAGTLG